MPTPYFSRPDSRIFNHSVDRLRRAFGRELVREHPVDADIVISVPDSSNTAALGYSHASGIPFEIGLIRNHYVGRTFISPAQNDREAKVKLKFNPVRGVLKGKRVVLVEDSIVRGTTLKQLVSLVRGAGAREIHIRVSSPPIKFPCFCGMDFPSFEELIANNKDFDLIMFPNRRHGFGNEPYMTRRRWDYFVKHLLGAEPPREYEMKTDTSRR